MRKAVSLSLLKYCIPCKAKCCKKGKSIGSPILSKDEMLKIKKVAGGNFQEVTSPTGETYYIIIEQKGTNRCFFLTKNNRCKIQSKKPLDCLCYPIKAIHRGKSVRFVVYNKCPATAHLNNSFIRKAKETALKSLKRFNPATFQHWIDTCEIWAKNKKEYSEI